MTIFHFYKLHLKKNDKIVQFIKRLWLNENKKVECIFEIVQNIVGFEIICVGSHAPKNFWCRDTTVFINVAHGQSRKNWLHTNTIGFVVFKR